jgi:hypothetical protein
MPGPKREQIQLTWARRLRVAFDQEMGSSCLILIRVCDWSLGYLENLRVMAMEGGYEVAEAARRHCLDTAVATALGDHLCRPTGDTDRQESRTPCGYHRTTREPITNRL